MHRLQIFFRKTIISYEVLELEICSIVIYMHFQSEIVTEEIVAVNQHANYMFMNESKQILTEVQMTNIKI